MTSRSNDLRRLATALAVFALSAACMRSFEPPPRPDDGPSSHRVRVLDVEGEPVASLSLRSRSAVLSDQLGVRVGRATLIQQRVEVRDRQGRLRWRILLVEGTGQGTASIAAEIERPGDGLAGRLRIDGGDVILTDPHGFELGRIRRSPPDDDGEQQADVYGAAGTDRLARAVRAEPRSINLLRPSGDPWLEFQGAELEPWQVAAGLLRPPSHDDYDAVDDEHLFPLGLLLFLWKLG